MGLDSHFYKCCDDRKEEIAYFRKHTMLVTFFHLENCEYLTISRNQLCDFVNTLKCVLDLRSEEYSKCYLPIDTGISNIVDDYNNDYYNQISDLYYTMHSILTSFDFDNYQLMLYCWW